MIYPFYHREGIIFIISFVVFISLNLVENLIHFTHGRVPENESIIKITKPNKKDWLKIVIVMIIFAIFQGVLTVILYDIVFKYI